MNLAPIDLKVFGGKFYEIWNSGWFLLTSGDYETGKYNCMTVSWGSFGCLWNLPVAMVVVRPSRYTYEFINQHESFTLCAFPEEYRKDLTYLGTHSGRDGDKISHSALTPCAARRVAAPAFEQAELAIECRRNYWQDLQPENFQDERIPSNYPQEDYHRMLVGEILAVSGDAQKYAVK
jgi:flavin reductase (DIM6/NTAB) family NADH-FMN oxidoreductase RutF